MQVPLFLLLLLVLHELVSLLSMCIGLVEVSVSVSVSALVQVKDFNVVQCY